jgi:hypothetical protein
MGSVSTNASPARPFQAPRTRLRLEAAYGGRYWRAARCVPGTAIGPASKFRPDRCWRLLRPLKRGTHLASLARQLFRRARRSTGACPLRGLRTNSRLSIHQDLRSQVDTLFTATRIECHLCIHAQLLIDPILSGMNLMRIPAQAPLHALRQIQTGVRRSIRPVRGAYALISPRTDSTPPHLCAPDTGAQ